MRRSSALARAIASRRPSGSSGARLPSCSGCSRSALAAGGWFGDSHEAATLKAATTPDPDERLAAVKTLLAEETRLGMMVGVAVGWALHAELENDQTEGDS